MISRILVYLVNVLHWFWVIVLTGGTFASWYYPRYQPWHLGALLITLIANLIWRRCPLTLLENKLRAWSNIPMIARDSFFTHWFFEIVRISVPQRSILIVQLIITAISLGIVLTHWLT